MSSESSGTMPAAVNGGGDGGYNDDGDSGSLRVGDHVYCWCSLGFIPGVYQHHGIIVEVEETASDGEEKADKCTVTIADFNAVISEDKQFDEKGGLLRLSRSVGGDDGSFSSDAAGSGSSSSPGGLPSRMRLVRVDPEDTKWRRVRYSAGWLGRTFRRSGTCTSAPSDPLELVLARVRFLMDKQGLIPPYHVLRSNCECVAVWCKTGRWCTLQGSSFLHVAAAGQAKGAASLAAFAAAQQVTVTTTVPAAGVWGWLGFTTQATAAVPLLAAHPYLVPILAGYGALAVGVPVAVLHKCRQFWDQTTNELNDAFWSGATSRPDVIVDCIKHWSSVDSR